MPARVLRSRNTPNASTRSWPCSAQAWTPFGSCEFFFFCLNNTTRDLFTTPIFVLLFVCVVRFKYSQQHPDRRDYCCATVCNIADRGETRMACLSRTHPPALPPPPPPLPLRAPSPWRAIIIAARFHIIVECPGRASILVIILKLYSSYHIYVIICELSRLKFVCVADKCIS